MPSASRSFAASIEGRTISPQAIIATAGEALLAAVSTGYFKDYSIAKEKANYIEPMEPIQENHEKYMAYFKIYRNLYQHIKSDYKDLAKIVREKE